MLKFDFYNHTRQQVSKKLFEKILKSAKKVLIKEKKMSAAQIFCFELSLIGLAAMARINKRYRGRNRPTDVISLSYFNKNAKNQFIGEIFICMPYVIKQAKKIGNTLEPSAKPAFYCNAHTLAANGSSLHKEAAPAALPRSLLAVSVPDTASSRVRHSRTKCAHFATKAGFAEGSLNKELQFLFIHGLLHVFGYDHKKKADAEKMERLTEKICFVS